MRVTDTNLNCLTVVLYLVVEEVYVMFLNGFDWGFLFSYFEILWKEWIDSTRDA
jgi:hypothetical protein